MVVHAVRYDDWVGVGSTAGLLWAGLNSRRTPSPLEEAEAVSVLCDRLGTELDKRSVANDRYAPEWG